MKNLARDINMKFGKVDGAHVMTRVNMGFAPYDTLCLICAELDIDLGGVSDTTFDSTSIALSDFVQSANEETGYTVSVWFD